MIVVETGRHPILEVAVCGFHALGIDQPPKCLRKKCTRRKASEIRFVVTALHEESCLRARSFVLATWLHEP